MNSRSVYTQHDFMINRHYRSSGCRYNENEEGGWNLQDRKTYVQRARTVTHDIYL